MNLSSGVEELWLSTKSQVLKWLNTPGPKPSMTLLGSQSPTGLAPLFKSIADEREAPPQLVIVPDEKFAQDLMVAFDFFGYSGGALHLPAFDVSPYSNLAPHRRLISQRLRWLFNAQNAKAGQIFIATVPALLQRTIPFQTLAQSILSIRPGEDLPPKLSEQLSELGYSQAPIVEDVGTYAVRGGIVDIFSPAYTQPLRLELFGDTIDSIRFFDPDTQRSSEARLQAHIIPAAEIIFSPDHRQRAAQTFKASINNREVDASEAQSLLHAISLGNYVHGLEFLCSFFYETPGLPLDHFSQDLCVWRIDPSELVRKSDELHQNLKSEYNSSTQLTMRPHYSDVYATFDLIAPPEQSRTIDVQRILIDSSPVDKLTDQIAYGTSELKEFSAAAKAIPHHGRDFADFINGKFKDWKKIGARIFLSTSTENQAQRLKLIIERTSFKAELVGEADHLWSQWVEAQNRDPNLIHIVPRDLPESVRISAEDLIFLREVDLFGKRSSGRKSSGQTSTSSDLQISSLQFNDLRPKDLVVHKVHGVGEFEGLKRMLIQGVEAELIQLRYKGNDRLYLPVFRIAQIHKFSGPSSTHILDKLGGTSFEKAKVKVRSHLRDIASELIRLYAARSQMHRPPLPPPDDDYYLFESAFPYEETTDQRKAINDILKDLCEKESPMDRLVCGDVGFGKTEVALRAAFKVAQSGRQVAVIVPTTVLCFQHTETFQKRFKDWPLKIRSINRFVPKKDITNTLKELAEGKVDILIGTHRLLSKDVAFKNLGLLIVDEEQKFGVQHKERLRKFKVGVDTLSMSATPIPRTLNMSLMGLRDLSLINTPPADRLPTRTFVTKFDPETIRKAVESEIARGGQAFFIHNRIESIYALLDELKTILPGVKMGLGHGQMPEDELENVMISFFHGEIDMLVCTTIVESGMDVPRANTMFIDNAQQLGLSQLYQLRGRVGRSKERAYCYLMVPAHRRIESDAQERLKIIQENSALGSGIRIAHHDLELRGGGDLLGEHQSGHINAVGYEMYLELLEAAVHEAKGDKVLLEDIEPEINLRIPALIPDEYIPDIRLRLSIYRRMADISSEEDLDRIEDDLRDQYGKPPEQVINLMGIMLVRKICKDLAVKDLSGGKNGVSLLFSNQTQLSPEIVIELTNRQNKKYSLAPDNRLNVRMHEQTWPRVYEELSYLKSLL